MRNLDKALVDIAEIRSRIAASTAFHGFGPTALAATAVIALITAAGQSAIIDDPSLEPDAYFVCWIAAAVVCAGIIGVEMIGRSRRIHSGLADVMIYNAIQSFLPAGAAGVGLTFALWRFAPDAIWMLPGLWQILVGLGIFAAARTLPRGVSLAGAWYFVSGFAVLAIASGGPALSPWFMGVPFFIGQAMLAVILHLTAEPGDGEA